MLKYFFSACLFVLICKSASDKPRMVSFNGGNWLFPITVGDAVKRYNLSYKPPGYYYAEIKNGSTVQLMYTYKPGSFFNEHQLQEILYDRSIVAYIHTFKNYPGRLDSLRQILENQFKKKMEMHVDTQRFGVKNMSVSLKRSLPNGGAVRYELMQVDSSLTIGLRHKPSMSKEVQPIEVYLFYKLLQDKIMTRMISF